MNLDNYGVLTGRLAKDPTVFENSDGSRHTAITVAVKNNFRSANGQFDVNFIDLEGYISAAQVETNKANSKPENGVYAYMHKGDPISVAFSMRRNKYNDQKTGETVYKQVCFVDTITLRGTKKQAGAEAAAEAQAVQAEEAAEAVSDGDGLPF